MGHVAHSARMGAGGGRGAVRPEVGLGYAWALALVAAATAAALVTDALLELPDVALLYLAAIMLSAAWHGRGPSTFAAAISVAAFNYFLVEPRFTFEVAEPRYVLTFTMMFGVGLVISGLTSRLRRQQREAEAREAKTHALYALGRALAAASGPDEILRVVVEQARRAFATQVELVDVPPGREASPRRDAAAVATAIDERRVVASTGALVVPLVAGDAVHGVLVFADPEPVRRPIDPDFLESFVRQGAIAIAQGRAAVGAAQAESRARAEEVRSTLLAAVSHDLRTPLAVITGAATTLQVERLAPEQREELLATVADEAERLEQMIGNLLDMTRLHAGGVELRAQWVPLEEVVGSALLRLERRLGERPVVVAIAADLPLLWVDPVLLEQALVNLADNAVKYSPDHSAIELRSFVRGETVVVEVLDRGPGLPIGLGPRVFEKFVRGDARDRDGFGLGLAICRAIVELHGGGIAARPRDGGGACLELTLPLRVDQPAAALDHTAALDAPAVRESA